MKKILFITLIFTIVFCFAPSTFAEDGNKIGNENGFNLRIYDLINSYNNTVSGKDRNYVDYDESLAINIDEGGVFIANIPILKDLSAFHIFFRVEGKGIYSIDDNQFPDELNIFTHGRKDLVYKEGGIEMMPKIFAAFVYLCDSSITNSSSAKQRAEEIIDTCKETHDWVQTDNFDYYCAETDAGDNEIYLRIAIKNHGVESELKTS